MDRDADMQPGSDYQVLNMEDGPGVGQDLLETLPSTAVVAYRGEPTASERGMLSWPMSDDERRQFASGMERIGNRWRNMNAATLREYLDDLGKETTRLRLDLHVKIEEPAGSQDAPIDVRGRETRTSSPNKPRADGSSMWGKWHISSLSGFLMRGWARVVSSS